MDMLKNQEMDSISSKCDEVDDMGFQFSSSADQSFTEITSNSILSGDSFAYCRTDSETSAFSGLADEISSSETDSPLFWKGLKSPDGTALSRFSVRKHNIGILDDEIQGLDFELMKERFAKLLLGEDMSGSGKGESIALTISNAITNFYASIFGQHQRLEPLNLEKKLTWKREMNCLSSVCDHIVEFSPTLQNLKDGTTLEVMTSRPRPDIYINLPALKKLDAMLLDILDSFEDTEFWYADQGRISGNSAHSGSFRRILQPRPQRKEGKWWLPVPCISPEGLSEKSKKHLRQKRDFANQIHKAAMAINTGIIAEMQVPEPYLDSLPKSGKASIGDTIYNYMYNTRKYSADHLLDSLGINSEREALELADKIEASMYTWRRKMWVAHSKSSWVVVKDLVSDIDRCDKNHLLADRANTLLLCLKQRYPELSQSTLDSSKIQYNKDIGQAVLESYSRVLESLAFNIVAWIEDVLYVDHKTMTKQEQGTGNPCLV